MARHVSTTGIYSLEFESKGSYCYLSVRFWKQDTLTKVQPHSLSSNWSALHHLASHLCILLQATAFQCVRFFFESCAASRMVSLSTNQDLQLECLVLTCSIVLLQSSKGGILSPIASKSCLHKLGSI